MFSSRTEWSLAPNRLSRLAEARRRSGDLLDLTASNPTRAGFNYARPAILAAIGQSAALRYDPDPQGLLPARQAVSAYYSERGAAVEPGRIFLTPGTSEAYSHLFRLLCNAGEAVLAPTPSYPLFDLLADINDVRLGTYPLLYDEGWHLDAAALDAAIERDAHVRALLVIHPNNPTGSYLTAAAWQTMQQLAASRQLAIIVDEVFFDYPLEGTAVALDLANAVALTFVLNGLSKTAALPQMKLAWIAVHGPAELAEPAMRRLEVIQDVYLSVDTPIQAGAAALLATRAEMQGQIISRTRANLAELDRRLALAPGAAVQRLRVEGGWNAILRLPRVRTDEEWAEMLVEEAGVLTHPGHFYAFPREAHLVISLLTAPDEFTAGMERLLTTAGRTLGAGLG